MVSSTTWSSFYVIIKWTIAFSCASWNVSIQFQQGLFFATFKWDIKTIHNPNIHLKLCNDLIEATIENNTHYFQFCGVITFYSKSSITYALLFYCVSTNALINWEVGFGFERSKFVIKVEAIAKVMTFTKKSQTSSQAFHWKWSLSFCSFSTCHSLNFFCVFRHCRCFKHWK